MVQELWKTEAYVASLYSHLLSYHASFSLLYIFFFLFPFFHDIPCGQLMMVQLAKKILM